MKKIIIIIIIGALFFSCSNKVEKTLRGWWTIDTIYYMNYNVKQCLIGNSLNFYRNECTFPITENYCEDLAITYDEKGTWQVSYTDTIPIMLLINSKNKMFAGRYHVIFKADEQNKLLKMKINSDNLYIVCRKGLYNFDKNKETIESLVKISKDDK